MAFDFEKRKRPAKAASSKSAYQKRAEADQKRYKRAVYTDFYIWMCFRTAEGKSAFDNWAGADADGVVFGDVVRGKLGEPAVAPKRAFGGDKFRVEALPNPVLEIQCNGPGDFERYCLEVAHAVGGMLKEADSGAFEPGSVFESRFATPVVFEDGEDAGRFIAEYSLGKFGYTYMDGDKAAAALGIG